jgi:hypothetical protein
MCTHVQTCHTCESVYLNAVCTLHITWVFFRSLFDKGNLWHSIPTTLRKEIGVPFFPLRKKNWKWKFFRGWGTKKIGLFWHTVLSVTDKIVTNLRRRRKNETYGNTKSLWKNLKNLNLNITKKYNALDDDDTISNCNFKVKRSNKPENLNNKEVLEFFEIHFFIFFVKFILSIQAKPQWQEVDV